MTSDSTSRPKTSVTKKRRDYNQWVADETLEDYSLRYAPQSFRKWPEWLLASTALGGISFLALEAIGASLAISYGFANAFWAIVVVSAIIFVAGVPIAYYAARNNIDMDLLTRGAGFGYIGSTLASVIYASFTFIFFALEAAILAQALELYFHLPLSVGYFVSSIVVIPIVFYGVTAINQLQLWTQPIWLVLMVVPYVFVALKEPDALANCLQFAGKSPSGAAFDPKLFGLATAVSFSSIAQLGEQIDYLRFLPDLREENKGRWWAATIAAGPGWVVLGALKQLGGVFLAALAVSHGISYANAKQPVQMYLEGFLDTFGNPETALFVSMVFVVVSQIKINVTNAYAGSLAWSNFFSRLTHSHPGRVVWLVFNVAISLVLMEFGLFETLESVLALYSNVAISWIGALVADLVINKPLGLSPPYLEFKRAYLYDINPVGVGATAIASLVSILAFLNFFGDYARAYSAFIALGLAFVLAPTIAWLTDGKYYIARPNTLREAVDDTTLLTCSVCEKDYEAFDMAHCPVYAGPICSLCCTLDTYCHDRCKKVTIADLSALGTRDLFPAPAHDSAATDLSDLSDLSAPSALSDLPDTDAAERVLATRMARPALRGYVSSQIGSRLQRFSLTFAPIFGTTIVIVGLVYYFAIGEDTSLDAALATRIGEIFLLLAALLGLVAAAAAWWLVLSEESRELAEAELDAQNEQLQTEVRDRRRAEVALQDLTHALEVRVEERTAELSHALKTLKQAQAQLIQTEKLSSLGQLVAGVAHEINNPVNFIHGNLSHATSYIEDLLALIEAYEAAFVPTPSLIDLKEELELEFIRADLPQLLASMHNGTERIREIVKSLRVFSRLDESSLKTVDLHECLDSTLTILTNRLKPRGGGTTIEIAREYGDLPPVECYAGQLNQVFMNLIANAIDAIEDRLGGPHRTAGDAPHSEGVRPRIAIQTRQLSGEAVQIAIVDNGAGIAAESLESLFDAFFTTKEVGRGTGLGLSICYQIVVEKHQGRLYCESEVGAGTTFFVELPVRTSARIANREPA